jgi:hypothetical protein
MLPRCDGTWVRASRCAPILAPILIKRSVTTNRNHLSASATIATIR